MAKASEKREIQNRILRALDPADLERIGPKLKRQPVKFKETIFEPNQPVTRVIFPEEGVFSILTVLSDGTQIEVGTVGREGMVGLPVFLGARMSPGHAFCQVPGEAFIMSPNDLRQEVKLRSSLVDVLHRYTQALFNQIAQSATCNRLHSMEERCSRWLLMTQDRTSGDVLPLTHEFLSQMLGVRRAGVSIALATLQKAGLVEYNRGEVTVVNRRGLEEASCECYVIVKKEFERLVGY